MDLIELKNRLKKSFSGTEKELQKIMETVEKDQPVFPFNNYEYLIFKLIQSGRLSYEQYLDIRTEYINKNPYLKIFEKSAPTGLGMNFAENYVIKKCSNIKIPSKKIDPNYSRDYDLWMDGIRIEVKASRAVDKDSKEPLYMKALTKNTNKRFLMNFQQLKPQYCDVFIWVAVFRDEITLWIMSSSEVQNHPLFSKGQHRGNRGNEGQLHIKHDNIHNLDKYVLNNDDDLERAIRLAAKRK